MFSIITKAEYFNWLDGKLAALDRQELKNVQDAFILSRLSSIRNMRILEVGGGQSRVLSRLDDSNELWNADRFEGDGNGPTEFIEDERINLVKCFIGAFDRRLPDSHFDFVLGLT